MKQPTKIESAQKFNCLERTAMNPFSIAMFVLAALSGVGAVVMLVVHISQKTHANQREAEMNNPPQNPPANYVAPTQTEVDELKAKAKGSFWTMVVLAGLAIALFLVAIFIPTAPAAPVSSAGGPTAPVSVGPAAGAATSCTDPRPADANGFTTECGADGQWHFVPLNGIANTPVCTETERDAASKGLTYTDCQYYDVDSTWKLLSAYYAGVTSSGGQNPTNTTCTQGTMPVEAGFTFTWDAGTCSWIKTATVTACTQGTMPVEAGFTFTWDAGTCSWIKTAVATSGGPTIITVPNPISTTGMTLQPLRLKYSEKDCDPNNLAACRIAGQYEFPAIFVRNIQSGDKTLVEGIVAIQQLAASANVPTWDAWATFNVDPVYATFVWCPGNNCQYPPDTAFPLMGIPGLEHVQYSIAIVQAHDPAQPSAGITDVSCPNGDCWAAPLQ